MSSIVPLEGEQLDARPTDIFRSKHEGKVSVSQEDASGVKRSPSQYDVIHGGASVSQDEVTRNGESVSQDEATRSGESVSQDKATRSGEPVSQDEATRSGEPVSQNEATRSGVSVSQNEATRSGESVFRIDAIRGREPVSPDVAHGRDRLVSQDDAIKNKESIPKDVAHGSDGSVSQGIVLSSSAQALSSVHYPLAHWELLGKRFQDYKQSCPFLMIPQQKEGLLSLLPLFMQACEQTAGVLCLPDITLMASDLGTLLAVEMRKRISNKPAGAARLSLTSFLLGAEEGMSGHLLLRSVHLLSQTNQDIRGCLIKTGLPDVFLQSLYLFLAFPPGQGGLKDLLKSETLVQDIFVQIMLSLCSQVQGVDEISRSSEFDCLLKAAASGWDRCDVRWTDAVHKVLRAMSNALSPGVVQYLHTSRCIPRFLQTLSQQVSAIPPTVLYQITNILLSFLTHSYPISPSLIQDFDDTQGYPLLLKILLRCEGEADSLITGHLDDLLSFLSALVICGKSEVKVSGQVLHPQLPGFSVGRTTGSGRTVKNLQAFQVLQSAFQSSVDALLCGKLLSAMQNIWAMEHCNFFLLEWSLQPITQFVEILPLKPPAVHLQFFQLIQYVVSDLSFIPHQTLHKLQEMIKQNQSPACTLEALRLLQSIIPISALFCDLFRDSGLLGMLLTQLRNHAKALRRAAGSALTGGEGECDRGLTIARLQTVGFLIQASVRNVVIIKDYGMIPYIKIFLDDMGFRKSALFILEHLSDIDPDEYMSTVMGALCSSTQAEITLKMDLLKSLQQVLRSPRERACFRNAAGFDVLLSLLSDMEGSLCCPPAACWSNVQPFHILRLIRATLAAMSAALCQDTINQHFVQGHEVFQKMAEDLMQLGCFCHPKSLCLGSPGEPQSTRTLHEILRLAVSTQSTCPQSLRSCFIILSLLLDMATGTLSRCGQELNEKETTIELPMMVCKDTQEVQTEDEFQQFVEDLFDKCPESFRGGDTLTVEPGALCVIISLIQSAYSEDTELSKEFQCAVLEVIHSLGRSERQRQVLSESQLLGCIAKFCRETLGNYGDPLRLPLVRLFEKLACQAVHPDVLRMFLCCSITKQNNPEVETGPDNPHSLCLLSGSILHTSMSLVSMTSPRRFQMHAAAMSPSFVEFDMASHGYGAAFLPTIATVLGSNVEEMLTGGVGPGVRSFPPPGGLSLSCWFMVNRFCLAPDPHPVRFLTIVRHASRSQQHYVCLSISLNAVEGSLVISTEEQEFQPLDMMEVDLSPCDAPRPLSQVCLNVSGHVVTEQWHHLSVVLKEVKRSCVVSAWIDGQVLGSAEMRYIQRLPGGISSLDPFSLVDIHAYLGTPRMWRQRSPLLWRLGPSHLFEEVLSEEMLCQIQRLGPSYCGSFSNGVISPALSEEKVNFGVSVLRSCISTISQIREMYNDVDGRHVAKELGVTSRDNCTPIFLARNLVSDVLGAARTLGAVTIQSDGVRIFHSSPAADALNYIGGPAVILGLVSMATDDQALYAAIKALVSVLSSSVLAEQLMHRIDGHRLLGFLLTQKSHLLNPRIFQLLLSITGTAEVGVEPAPPLNLTALENILCNFQLWLEVPGDLDIALLTHLEDILRCPREASITQHVQLVPRLVYLLSDPRVTQAKVNHICSLIKLCLCCDFNRRDITSLGLFLVSLLPTSSVDEKQTNPQQDLSMEDLVSADSGVPSGRMIWLRNQLLRVLISMMCPPTSSLSEQQQEQMLVTLGADWFLLFVQPSIHHSSIVLGMRLVGQLLQSPNLLVRFKQMAKAGACVENCTKDRNIMMDNLRSHPSLPAENFSLVSGFSALHEAICQLVDWPQIYVHVSSILLRSLQGLESSEGALDVMLHDLFQHHNSVQILRDGLCMEAALLLLTMVKAAMSQEKVSIGTSEALKFSNSVMQLLCLVYQSYPHDPLWITADFIQKLAALLILPVAQELCDSVSEEVPSGTEKLLGEPDKQQVQSARKPVQELLHLILRQSLTQIIAVKQHHPLEYLLETSPAESSLEQRNQFQTEILQCTMKMFHALSHREERSGQRAIHDPAAGAEILEETAIANLTYFSQKLLDKLYCGVFTADPCEILLFFIKQITTVTHVTAPCNREGLFSMLYSCLNRSILHCLSRSRQTLTGILRLLRVFRLLLSHWDVIFTTYNSSLNFAACLMHCLFQIYAGSYPEGFGLNTKCRGSSWQMIFLSKNEDEEQVTEGPGLQEVYSQVLQVVHAVWEQLMVHRRQVLEEHFKMDLSIKQSEGLIFEVTPLWEETASKAWQQYLTSEKKNLKSKSRPLAGTGQKISAAVRGLYGGNEQEAELKAQDVASILDKSRRSAQEVFKCLHRDHLQMQQCKLMAACRDWSALEEELISEVGVWRPLCSRRDQRWELSPYEGPWRVRMRMQPSPRKLETLKSAGSKEDAFLHRVTNQVGLMSVSAGGDSTGLIFFPALQESKQSALSGEECPESLSILQEFPEREKISEKMSVLLVEGHMISEGVLLFGRDHFYLCSQFTLSLCGEVTCNKHGLSSIRDPFIHDLCYKSCESTQAAEEAPNPGDCPVSPGREKGSVAPWTERWSYQDVLELQPMCFLMQELALEIFFKNRVSKFVVFPNNNVSTAMKWFHLLMPSLKAKAAVEDPQNIRCVPGEKLMLHKWQKREVGNFEYLMFLNRLSGRTIRDLMQYPVLPWVLRDYQSQTLDLSDSKTFRDLSKPMGAQNQERRQKFIQRYQEVEKSEGDLSGRCHYCTHYSSASIVSSYLVRVEPFTQAMRSLQGGSLDLADRMFHSVRGAWESASRENMSDVRELIPEFFYLHEMFTNCNHCQLGCMQDGTVLGDVILPPWAQSDPHTFIRLHREALECDHVSSQLHHWIDLVFGYKQQGAAAVQALNAFHPYFYGSPVHLNSADPLIRSTLIGFISNFGQIPKQIFIKPHPPRQSKDSVGGHMTTPFYIAPSNLKHVTVTPKAGSLRGAVGQMLLTDKDVFAVEKNQVLLPPTYSACLSWGHNDGSLKLHSRSTHKVVAVWQLMSQWGWCHSVVCPLPTLIITAMSSSVVCVWNFNPPGHKERQPELQLKKVLPGHGSAVLCICGSAQYGVLISGSEDGSCIIWDLNKLLCIRRLPTHPGKVMGVTVSDGTGAVATWCCSFLYVWSVNGDPVSCVATSYEILSCCFGGLSVIVTGSEDGFIRLWKKERAGAQREIGLGGVALGTSLCMYHQLHVGVQAAGKQHPVPVTALTVSRNCSKLLVGDDRGVVTCWSLDG